MCRARATGDGLVGWICLAWVCLAASTEAAPRLWTMYQGSRFQAEVADCGTNQVVFKRADGTMFYMAVTNLVAQDQAALAAFREQKKAATVAKPVGKDAPIEISKAIIQKAPAALSGNRCFMEAEFLGFDATEVDHPEEVIGFVVKDKDGALFSRCRVSRTSGADLQLAKLHRGDKVRLTGLMAIFPTDDTDPNGAVKTFDINTAEFYVNKIELLKAAPTGDASPVKQQHSP